MNIHHRIVAALHILFGVFGLALVALVYVGVDFAFSFAPIDDELRRLVLNILGVIAVPVLAFCCGEVLAGLFYFGGRLGARPWLIAFGAVQLINVPFGTVLGIYTLVALLSLPPLDSLPPAATASGA